MNTITPLQFVNKWRQATLKERAAAQEHFLDLCHLLNHPTPAEDDPTGARFTFSVFYTQKFMKPGHYLLRLDTV